MTKTIESPELTVLLNHQQAISNTQEQLVKLDDAIALQKANADELRNQADAIAALEAQRGDLLADIAIGEDKTQELQLLDANLEQQKSAAQARTDTLASIKQTTAGLERKRAQVHEELQKLQAQSPKFQRALVKEQAETLGAEYAELALRLAGLYGRLTALNNIWVGLNGISYKPHGASLEIPAFSLDAVAPHAMKYRPHAIALEFGTHGEVAGLIGSEKDRLRASGVEIE